MSYVEQNLNRNEEIVKKAERSAWLLVGAWVFGILFFWLLFIPLIKAVIATVRYRSAELAITNKRIIGKTGVVNSGSLDAPLNKIQNVSVSSGLGGKIFGYGTVQINTAAGVFTFTGIKQSEQFKAAIMNQIEQYEEDKIKEQAAQMANAMASVINK